MLQMRISPGCREDANELDNKSLDWLSKSRNIEFNISSSTARLPGIMFKLIITSFLGQNSCNFNRVYTRLLV